MALIRMDGKKPRIRKGSSHDGDLAKGSFIVRLKGTDIPMKGGMVHVIEESSGLAHMGLDESIC